MVHIHLQEHMSFTWKKILLAVSRCIWTIRMRRTESLFVAVCQYPAWRDKCSWLMHVGVVLWLVSGVCPTPGRHGVVCVGSEVMMSTCEHLTHYPEKNGLLLVVYKTVWWNFIIEIGKYCLCITLTGRFKLLFLSHDKYTWPIFAKEPAQVRLVIRHGII